MADIVVQTQLNQISGTLNTVVAKLGNHDKRFDEHTKILNEHSRSLERIEKRLDKHDELFSQITGELCKMNRRFNVLEERTEYLPKLYNAVDKFMGEILESRVERVILTSRVKNHEDRLVTVENKVGIVAPSRDMF